MWPRQPLAGKGRLPLTQQSQRRLHLTLEAVLDDELRLAVAE
jgi:hypothetical protein